MGPFVFARRQYDTASLLFDEALATHNRQVPSALTVIPMTATSASTAGEDFVHIAVENGNEVITAFPKTSP